jgi:hypothetical protein
MATKAASDSGIYQIKVTLLGTKPPIWRRLLLPADLTLAQLHDVLQIAMGWEDVTHARVPRRPAALRPT